MYEQDFDSKFKLPSSCRERERHVAQCDRLDGCSLYAMGIHEPVDKVRDQWVGECKATNLGEWLV